MLQKTTTTTSTQTVTDPLKQCKITINLVENTVEIAVYTDEGGSFGLVLPSSAFSADSWTASLALAQSAVLQTLISLGFTDPQKP